MQNKKLSDTIKDRIHRHHQLIKLIQNYTRTTEENKKLERIKNNTHMEINIRYLKSQHNRYYKFPKNNEGESEDEGSAEEPLAKK